MSKRLFQSLAAITILVTALGACTGSPLGNDDVDCSEPGSPNYDASVCEPIIIGTGS